MNSRHLQEAKETSRVARDIHSEPIVQPIRALHLFTESQLLPTTTIPLAVGVGAHA